MCVTMCRHSRKGHAPDVQGCFNLPQPPSLERTRARTPPSHAVGVGRSRPSRVAYCAAKFFRSGLSHASMFSGRTNDSVNLGLGSLTAAARRHIRLLQGAPVPVPRGAVARCWTKGGSKGVTHCRAARGVARCRTSGITRHAGNDVAVAALVTHRPTRRRPAIPRSVPRMSLGASRKALKEQLNPATDTVRPNRSIPKP